MNLRFLNINITIKIKKAKRLWFGCICWSNWIPSSISTWISSESRDNAQWYGRSVHNEFMLKVLFRICYVLVIRANPTQEIQASRTAESIFILKWYPLETEESKQTSEKIQPDFVIANENKANENLDVVNTSSVRISQSIWPQFNPKCIE